MPRTAVTHSSAAETLRAATAAMGTRFELVIEGPDAERHRPAAEEAIESIEECHRRYSRFAPASLVSHINREAARRPVRVDADTWQLLSVALDVQRASGGAFSILAQRGRRAPEGALAVDAATRTIRLAPGVSIDLGGIAKGHALDLAERGLRANGVTRALLHGGTSSIAAIGAPHGAEGWRIAIGDGENSPIVVLADACVSVSAAVANTPSGASGRPHHIIDARSGVTVDGTQQVAVCGPRCAPADAWATALVILGRVPASMPHDYSAILPESTP